MAGPLSLPFRYFAPVRADVGLKVVENMEHCSCFSASMRSLDGLVSALRVALVMAVAMTVERVGSKFCLHHNHVKYKHVAGDNQKEKEKDCSGRIVFRRRHGSAICIVRSLQVHLLLKA